MKQSIKARHYTTWQLITAYWRSEQRLSAYFYFAIILVMTVLLVGFDVAFNYWYNYFYNALQAYDVHGSVQLLVGFFILAAFFIVVQVYRYYVSQLFALRWRRWLTEQLVGRWLQKRGYYYLENFDERTDNPDQRIQEDAGALVTNSIDLTVGLVSAVTTFPAFVYILWTLSGVLTIPLGPLGTLKIHGYLVWVGILYNLIGTLITFKVGRPLIGLNFEQQRREATFRFAAMDLRSHSEPVALYHGEHHQQVVLQGLFKGVLANWYQIILRQKLLLWFTGGYNQAAVVLPLVVALPNYFRKVFLLGGLMQSIRAFSSVQESLSFLVNAYTQIAQWRAISQRLITFVNHLHDVEVKAEKEDKVNFSKHPHNQIIAKAISIKTPQQKPLLDNINEKFTHGQHYLIKGESGIGKSTFLRTLAGIWPYAKDEKYVVFLHGTTWVTKQWPETYWMQLADLVAQAGYRIKISGGNDEEVARAQRIGAHNPAVDVMPRLQIGTMAKLLANAEGAVAVDTGFGHLAAALDLPLVSIYGSTNPKFTGALGHHSIHLTPDFSCAPCLSRTCTYKQASSVTPACYAELSPRRVWESLRAML